MKTYECIVYSGNKGNQIIIFVRAYSATNAKMVALTCATQQFGRDAGVVTVVSVKEV